MRPRAVTLTPQELEIMKVVWRLEKSTVRAVYEELRQDRSIAYTTVMTMMNILEQKGFLSKKADERSFVYAAKEPQERVVGGMVKEFVDRVFNGAAQPLLLHLVQERKLSASDVAAIERLLKEAKTK
jgi:BlaI family penicillinase repressor